MLRHAPCNSDQALIIWLYLRRELSIIYVLSFIHSVQDNLPQVFIEPVGFTAEIILKEIISRQSC